MTIEEQLVDASESFVKNMLKIIAEVVLILVSGAIISHVLGIINIFELHLELLRDVRFIFKSLQNF